MKKFLALYMGTAEAFAKWRAMDESMRKEKEKAGMAAWGKWAMDNKASIVDGGAPVGKTKRIDKSGVSDIKNQVGAYTIVQAASHEEAAKLFVNHPHFIFFPGEWIEVMECLPIPGMKN